MKTRGDGHKGDDEVGPRAEGSQSTTGECGEQAQYGCGERDANREGDGAAKRRRDAFRWCCAARRSDRIERNATRIQARDESSEKRQRQRGRYARFERSINRTSQIAQALPPLSRSISARIACIVASSSPS